MSFLLIILSVNNIVATDHWIVSSSISNSAPLYESMKFKETIKFYLRQTTSCCTFHTFHQHGTFVLLLGIIKWNSKHLTIPTFTLIYKSMVKSHLDYCCPIWAPYKKGDIEALEKVQKKVTNFVPTLRRLTYADRLRACQLTTLHYWQIRGDMIEQGLKKLNLRLRPKFCQKKVKSPVANYASHLCTYMCGYVSLFRMFCSQRVCKFSKFAYFEYI